MLNQCLRGSTTPDLPTVSQVAQACTPKRASTAAGNGSQRCQAATVQPSAMLVARGASAFIQAAPVQCRQPEELQQAEAYPIPVARGATASVQAEAWPNVSAAQPHRACRVCLPAAQSCTPKRMSTAAGNGSQRATDGEPVAERNASGPRGFSVDTSRGQSSAGSLKSSQQCTQRPARCL